LIVSKVNSSRFLLSRALIVGVTRRATEGLVCADGVGFIIVHTGLFSMLSETTVIVETLLAL
jgi:hypothetical protein